MIFAARSSARRHGSQVCFELLIIAILWVMWLVGAVDTTVSDGGSLRLRPLLTLAFLEPSDSWSQLVFRCPRFEAV